MTEHRRTQTMCTAAFFELFETIYDLTWLFLPYCISRILSIILFLLPIDAVIPQRRKRWLTTTIFSSSHIIVQIDISRFFTQLYFCTIILLFFHSKILCLFSIHPIFQRSFRSIELTNNTTH